jgi:hypothetical protein
MERDPFAITVARLRTQVGAVRSVEVAGPFDPTGELAAPSPGEADDGLLALSTVLAITKSSERCGGEP